MAGERSDIGSILAKTIPFLAGKGIPSPRLEADLLLAKVLDLPRVKLYSQWDRELTLVELENYREIIRKRIQGWPYAYLTGKKAFLSWEFNVTPAVLIPRPETELLVEVVVDWVNQQPQNRPQLESIAPTDNAEEPEDAGCLVDGERPQDVERLADVKCLKEPEEFIDPNQTDEHNHSKVQSLPEIRGVDVGTGSGIIAISLAKLLPQSNWDALEISETALEVARENAGNLGVTDRIRFQSGDLLAPFFHTSAELKFDLIVANPPYIPTAEISSLSVEVQKEPILALDGGSDGLDIYRKLLPQALPLLADNGIIAFEHGHDQRVPLEELATGLGLSCTSFADLSGRDRVMLCQKV
ncbi:MAG TPA: HemK/PrmC family methyltransferase [Bacillota bacterium]|nr:HemK/PrmC family methyltransferase [Bacillota bacterium]